ncbi:hypothetical protein EHF33_20385 (plasmid) [Deinococcus psychrotolerans]|uniref:Uncharacterized protein n=1 Tax=Deinococcus psychrotolerans TaxID=2489213 RepID=A0A3G8YVQ7_9DEIO|nr:hypothetical protein [Deinococcus psychrotolerans]AZI45266.1 hypothetical protein EHF33_20385 [Deinococcus psychrotolerans]
MTHLPVNPKISGCSFFAQRLAVVVGEETMRLPGWASSLVALGQYLATLDDAHPPLTAVLELPTRRYAALLVALGAVYGRQTRPVFTTNDFDVLASLSTPIKVRYRYQSVAFDGVLEGCVDRDGEAHLVIGRPGGAFHYLPRSMNSQLIAIGEDVHLGGHHRNLQFSGEYLRRQWAFAAGVFCKVDPSDYLLADRQDVILFGPAGPLNYEARLPMAIYDSEGVPQFGELREAVRVQDWRDEGSVNTELLPLSSEGELHLPEEARLFPPIAVFDGGFGYANWRYLIQGHHVALLTPGRIGFQQGDAAVSESFYARADEVELPWEVTQGFPAGQLLAFTRHA